MERNQGRGVDIEYRPRLNYTSCVTTQKWLCNNSTLKAWKLIPKQRFAFCWETRINIITHSLFLSISSLPLSAERDSVWEEEEASTSASTSSRETHPPRRPSGRPTHQRLWEGDEATWFCGHGLRVQRCHLLPCHPQTEGQRGESGEALQECRHSVHRRRSQRCQHDKEWVAKGRLEDRNVNTRSEPCQRNDII